MVFEDLTLAVKCLLGLGCVLLGAAAHAGERPWLPADSVGMRYFAHHQAAPQVRTAVPSSTSAVVPSPDGKYFFFVSRHGVQASDANVYELAVYEADAVRRWLVARSDEQESSLRPYLVAAFESSSSVLPGIVYAQWTVDSAAIVFLGMSENGRLQVYRLEIGSGRIRQLTHHAQEIEWIGVGTRCALFQEHVKYSPSPWRYPVDVLEQRTFGRSTTWSIPADEVRGRAKRTVYAFCDERVPQPLNSEISTTSPLSFSPDEPLAVASSKKGWPPQFVLLDLEHARVESLLDVPVGSRLVKVGGEKVQYAQRLPFPHALWVPGHRRVILVNTTVPTRPGESLGSAMDGYIVDYDLESGRWTALEPMVGDSGEPGGQGRYVVEVGWLSRGRELLVRYAAVTDERAVSGTVFALGPDGWERRTVDAAVRLPEPSVEGVSVVLRQSANEPPRIVVSDGRQERTLTEPDPALRGIERAPVEPFQWQTPTGVTLTGGLTLPTSVPGTEPVPLVIQVYYYIPELFLPDGGIPGIDVAQSLAARGMAVLQMAMDSSPNDEGAEFVGRVDAAIEVLAQQGLIDPRRVGASGFSRAGYQVYYAITHPDRWPLAAAVCADSFTGSYTEYLFDAARYPKADAFEKSPGGSFWERKAAWLEHETSFNVDRVQTPVLFTSHSLGGARDPLTPIGIETLGAFQRNERPIEYLLLPQADHQVQRPQEQLALSEAVVDWMAFWLQGYEDPSPHKAVQYARWRPMRAQQERVVAGRTRTAPPPLSSILPLP